jgi:hypothetical protein
MLITSGFSPMKSPARKPAQNAMARRSRTRLAQFEVLEGRALFSVAKPQLDKTGAGHSVQTAVSVAEMPLQPMKIASSFLPGKTMDTWKEQVSAGDNLAVSVEETNGSKDLVKIKVLGPDGSVVGRTKFSHNPSLFVQAKTTGNYTIEVIDQTPSTKQHDNVTIQVLGINKGTPLPSATVDSGKRMAWIDGNVLSLADPSGEGFQITSNWQTSVQTDKATGLQFATYTTAGPSTIKLSGSTNDPRDQKLGITLNGTITIRTDPGTWGANAGTVASAVFANAPGLKPQSSSSNKVHLNSVVAAAASSVPTSIDANALFTKFNDQYGLGITMPGNGFGMASGNDLMARASFAGIPFRPEGTYFYAQKNTGASLSFGNLSASASASQTITVIVDPSDPFVFVAGGPIAFGASLKGLIPFVPQSSSYHGATFSGHFYGAVKDIPLGDLPATVSGMAVINVDPDHTGSSTLSTPGSSTAALFNSASVKSNLKSNSIDIGVNGTASVGTEVGGLSLSVDVAHATAAFVAAGTDRILKVNGTWQNNLTVPKTKPIDQINGSTFVVSLSPWKFGMVPNSQLYYQTTQPRPASFAIAGNTTDPFEGIPGLEGKFQAGPQFTMSVQSSGNSFTELAQNVKADFHGSANWGGYNFGHIDFSGDRNRVSFSAPMSVFVGTAEVSGDVDFRTGAFLASAKFGGQNAAAFFPGASGVTDRSLTVSLRNTPGANNAPNFSLYADVSISYRYKQNISTPAVYDPIFGLLVWPAVNLGDYGVYGSVSGRINIDPANTNYSASLNATGGLIFASKDVGGSVSVGFANKTISVGANFHVGGSNHWIGFSQSL